MCPSKSLMGGIATTVWQKSEEEAVEIISKNLEDAGTTDRILLENAGGLFEDVHPDKMRNIWARLRERFC